jgi:GT2 family glycosyltransferase
VEHLMLPEVTTIILNWNNVSDTLACLGSIATMDYPKHRVIVVDNGSTDDSVAIIAANYPEVTILETGENLGYTGGNNRGIEYALKDGCDYVWLLNDDVTVAPDSLSALISVAVAEPKAGLLGPKVYMREDPQRVLSAGGEFCDNWHPRHRGIGELDQGQFDRMVEVDYLSGCALLVSRRLIERAGGLDNDFFAYHEDIEWCYRGRQAGFQVLFVPQARVWHPDTLRRDADSALVTYYISRNQLLFMAKHHLGVGALARCLATYALRVVNWSVRSKWRHKRRQRDVLVWAMLDFSRRRFGKARYFIEPSIC